MPRLGFLLATQVLLGKTYPQPNISEWAFQPIFDSKETAENIYRVSARQD
jgi:hypothetical protein